MICYNGSCPKSCGLMMKKDKIQWHSQWPYSPWRCGLMMKKDKIQLPVQD